MVFDEPQILFGGGHAAINPQDGLALFGPYSPGRNRSSAILQRLFYQGVVSETGVAKEASQG
jgi:hypothetical protein